MSDPKTLLAAGHAARREHRPAEAREQFEQAAECARTADNQPLLAQALKGLGQIERDEKNLDAALILYEQAAAIHRSLDERMALAHTVRHVADILRGQKNYEQAASRYEEALAIYRRNGQTPALELANAIRGQALLKGDLGQAEEATYLWYEARHLYETAGASAGVAESESHIAFLLGR